MLNKIWFIFLFVLLQIFWFSCNTYEEGKFIILWEDNRNSTKDIYGQRFLSDGMAFGKNFLITNTTNGIQASPCVILNQNCIYTTWQDNRTESTGYDIWANILSWDEAVGVRPNDAHQSPQKFVLHQNYPNPFNSETKIRYSLPNSQTISLKIYDLLGREAMVLIDREYKTSGIHEIKCDAANLSSGIYYYQLQAGEFVRTRKMLLLR